MSSMNIIRVSLTGSRRALSSISTSNVNLLNSSDKSSNIIRYFSSAPPPVHKHYILTYNYPPTILEVRRRGEGKEWRRKEGAKDRRSEATTQY